MLTGTILTSGTTPKKKQKQTDVRKKCLQKVIVSVSWTYNDFITNTDDSCHIKLKPALTFPRCL